MFMKLLPQIELLLEILGSNHFPYNAMAQKFSAIVTSPLTSITVTFLCNYFKESVKCILKGNNFLFEGGQKKEKKNIIIVCRLWIVLYTYIVHMQRLKQFTEPMKSEIKPG